MKKIRIPNTELNCSSIGLGTTNAGLAWDGMQASRIFDTFIDLGGNLIDTAHVYSDWVKPEKARSERVIGEWVSQSKKRNNVIIMTKGGHPDMSAERPDLHNSRMAKLDMQKDIEGSLKKLNTDYIDIYFYHRDDLSQPVDELIEVMNDFVKQGKIRYYGCSNWTAERIKLADNYCNSKGYRGFVANQALLNLGHLHMQPLKDDTMVSFDDAMFEYHKNNNCNIAIPYTSICSGFFHAFAEKGADAVKNSVYYSEENVKLAKRVMLLSKEHNASITQVVLGYFNTQDFDCIPLYGVKSIDGLNEAISYSSYAFKKEDYVI